jgi:hypothetical protein
MTYLFLPIADGEGDRRNGGGGERRERCLPWLFPSTMLRMVPLPNFVGEEGC